METNGKGLRPTTDLQRLTRSMGGSVSCGLWWVCDQSGREVSPVVYGGFVNSRVGKCLLWFVTSRGGKCLLWFVVGL